MNATEKLNAIRFILGGAVALQGGSSGDTWGSSDGVMAYAELRIRNVEDGSTDLTPYNGYLYSEKMDGWFCIFDGKGKFYTKSGKKTLDAPEWFRDAFVKTGVAIAGEMVVDCEQATKVASLQKRTGPWKKARFYAFDLPGEQSRKLPFEQRTRKLKRIIKEMNVDHAIYIPQKQIVDTKAFLGEFYNITRCTGGYTNRRCGNRCLGEGVIITDPNSTYTSGRVSKQTRVKLKGRMDDEARVIGHNRSSRTNGWGSLKVEYNNKKFNLGIGFSKKQLANLPAAFPKGSLVKFSFRSVGENGIPKEARLVGVREKADMRKSPVKKVAPAKKKAPVKKAAPKKPPAKKKVPVKKKAPVKKAAPKKKGPVKKKAPVKKAASTKPPVKKKVPAKKNVKKAVPKKPPAKKKVVNKEPPKFKDGRLSARWYKWKYGGDDWPNSIVGDVCQIRKGDPKKYCLQKQDAKNGGRFPVWRNYKDMGARGCTGPCKE